MKERDSAPLGPSAAATEPAAACPAGARHPARGEAIRNARLGRSATAARQLRALRALDPADVEVIRWLGVALLDQDQIEPAIEALGTVVRIAPAFADAAVDLARAFDRLGNAARARTEVRRVLEQEPTHHRAWLAYGDVLVTLGQYAEALIAFERARLTDPWRPQIEAATRALSCDREREAEDLFRKVLKTDPDHPAALCGLAALAMSADQPVDAERLLRHALKQSTRLPLTYRGLAPVLVRLGRLEEALTAVRYLERIEPNSPQTWVASASVATRLQRYEEALSAYARATQLAPAEPGLRLSAGHLQKTLGLRRDSEASYKAALALDPGFGEAWWSLADLKNYVFGDAEVAAMQGLLDEDPSREGAAQVNFALGRALEQRGDYERAFVHYAAGNGLRRRQQPFDIDRFERRSARIRAFFDAEFFESHRGSGDTSNAPIFIVGLPRSGSTLIEQILASHSRVEGTFELPNILGMVAQFDDLTADRDGYPETVARAALPQLSALGRRYLEETSRLRSGRAHFTDKQPNNFSHVGLIHAILPRAIIIDARRHPMDACFSNFKQYFAEGQSFSYDLEVLGRYYGCYLDLMDHWEAVLPGRVIQVQYEELVGAPEPQIRRLLARCGLDFEAACLSFHATRRAVRTASAEQVRTPLYSSGVGYWERFGRQLEPLRRALGESLRRFDHLLVPRAEESVDEGLPTR
jgi:tetratricopeptide (TPR) repeat protein